MTHAVAVAADDAVAAAAAAARTNGCVLVQGWCGG